VAHGMANDLLSTVCLATDAPVVVAPAMNRLMWTNAATVSNCQALKERGIGFIGPGEGIQACGETGAGRLLEPEQIRDELKVHMRTLDAAIANVQQFHENLKSKHILITAGPTREAIDPVRYISNHSSGKMGFAIAEAARSMGAQVTLVAGPVSLECSKAIKRVDVISAQQMQTAVLEHASSCDVFISVAAVSDYRLENVRDQKIKKDDDQMQLSLVKNPDILQEVAALQDRPFCVGFAAETEKVEAHARGKLERKNLDMIAANHVGQPDNPVFGTDTNALDVYWRADNGHHAIEAASKSQVAISLLNVIAGQLTAQAIKP